MKHLISLMDQSRDDILDILNKAAICKERTAHDLATVNGFAFEGYQAFAGKQMLMLFEKGSTRTKLSFMAAAYNLGGHPIAIDAASTQFKLAHFKDEIRATMQYGDVLVYRAIDAKNVEFAASLNLIPVIDACSNKYHPCQALSDIFTMSEVAGGLDNIGKVVWLGIENNVSNTLALVCAKLGIHIYLAAPLVHPESVDPNLQDVLKASPFVHRTLDIAEALEEASFVHTDTWMDMEYFDGAHIKDAFKVEFQHRKELLMPYQISAELLTRYSCNAKIMHCMPCHEDYEITRNAIDHQNSVIFQQAKNREHVEKAILWWLFQE